MGQKKIHPRFSELADAYRHKALSRREFLRLSALLGISAGVTASIAGLPLAKKVWASAPKRGGILRVASQMRIPLNLTTQSGG